MCIHTHQNVYIFSSLHCNTTIMKSICLHYTVLYVLSITHWTCSKTEVFVNKHTYITIFLADFLTSSDCRKPKAIERQSSEETEGNTSSKKQINAILNLLGLELTATISANNIADCGLLANPNGISNLIPVSVSPVCKYNMYQLCYGGCCFVFVLQSSGNKEVLLYLAKLI